MNRIPVTLIVEDLLADVAARRVLAHVDRFACTATYGMKGNNYIRERLKSFNAAAYHSVYLVLTDLDRQECPPSLVKEWFRRIVRSPNLLFQVAVRETEAWLLADREAFARFARLRLADLPLKPELIPDPKERLIQLVAKSKIRGLREDIVPSKGTGRKHGPNYNGALSVYVAEVWRPEIARLHSQSLDRLIRLLEDFRPQLELPRNEPPPST